MKSLTGKHIHVKCQGTSGTHQAVWNCRNSTGSIKKCCSLTYHTSDGQDHTCQDSRNCGGKYNRKNSTELACSKSEACLTVRIRNRFQCFLGGTHDQGKYHDHHSQRTGKKRHAPVQCSYKEQHTEQTIYDRWNTGKCLCGNTDQLYKTAAFFCIFHKEDRCKDSYRSGNRQRYQCHDQGIDQ